MGRIAALWATLGTFLPSLSRSPRPSAAPCEAGCCRPRRGDLLPCCSVVLVEKAGAEPGASFRQTEQMPYTNKQPGGARAASPVNPLPLHQLAVLRRAAAAAKTLRPYHSIPQATRKAPQRVAYFYLSAVSCCLCHLQL